LKEDLWIKFGILHTFILHVYAKVEIVDDQIHIVLHGDISHYKEEVKTVQNESTLQKGEILWKE
jgi:ABC-type oligopeptide transport system ATPase subunit